MPMEQSPGGVNPDPEPEAQSFFARHKKLLGNIARVGITLAGVALVVTTVDLNNTLQSLRQANWPLIVLLLVGFQVGIVLRAVRWRVLLMGLGLRPSLPWLTGLYYAGAFFNTFLPTGFGGDVVRVFEVAREAKPDEAVATVVIDRASGLFVLFVMALLVLPFQWAVLPLQLSGPLIAACAAGIIGWFVLLETDLLVKLSQAVPVKAMERVTRLLAAIRRIEKRAVWGAVGISVLFNMVLIIAHWVMASAFGLGVPLWFFAVYVPITSTLLLLPSIQGWGVREPATVLLLSTVGVGSAAALAFALGVYLLTLSNAIIGGVYYAIYTVTRITGQAEKSA